MPEDHQNKGGLLGVVREKFEEGGKKAIWAWCMQPKHAHGKAKRFHAATHFARLRRNNSTGHERADWAETRRIYARECQKWQAEYEEQHSEAKWPDQIVVAELLYHAPPHFHMASPEREKLIDIGEIGVEKFECRIGEFPPFDTTEDVHVDGVSWHYRDPSRPWVPVPFNAAKLVKGGPWGCAFDANDLDGGGDQEYAFYIECGRRYR